MHVCVLGAGIVGLASAYELLRQGHRVTVIDQAAAPGEGASGGNGSQLSYSYVQPLADPSVWRQLPSLLFAPSSPLKLRPRMDPQQWRWAAGFMRACSLATSRETTRQLLALAAESRAGFDAMRAELAPDCDFSATGKLVLYSTRAGLDSARHQVDFQRGLGSEQRIVDAAECVAIEPALAGYQAHIAGAVYTPSECAADCWKLCQALFAALAQRGVEFRLGTTATSLRLERGRFAAVRTTSGDVAAGACVVALGSASYALGRQLGVRLPLYPLKGYSITLDLPATQLAAGTTTRPGTAAAAEEEQQAHQPPPVVSVTDSARKVVFARIGNRLRVAGMAEIVGADSSIPESRIATLRRATAAVFPQCGDAPELSRWTGMRPATPTARPIVGAQAGAPGNLLFNTGHGALGFTLAFGTAARIVAMVDALQGTSGRA